MNNQRLKLWPRPTAPAQAQAQETGLAVVTAVSQLPTLRPYAQAVVMIPNVPEANGPALFVGPSIVPGEFARLIRLGRTFHDPASPGTFVERVRVGYYAYERREVWRTCALAAAYAGAFGQAAVERPNFSYSEAVYRLSLRLGYDLTQEVISPTGARGPLADMIIALTDHHLWTAEGIAEWITVMELAAVSRAARPQGSGGIVTGRYNAPGGENG